MLRVQPLPSSDSSQPASDSAKFRKRRRIDVEPVQVINLIDPEETETDSDTEEAVETQNITASSSSRLSDAKATDPYTGDERRIALRHMLNNVDKLNKEQAKSALNSIAPSKLTEPFPPGALNEGCSPLMMACFSANYNFIWAVHEKEKKKEKEHKALSKPAPSSGRMKDSTLLMCVADGAGKFDARIKIAEILLTQADNVNVCIDRADGFNGWSAITFAAFNGNYRLVKLLLQHGAEVSPKTIEVFEKALTGKMNEEKRMDFIKTGKLLHGAHDKQKSNTPFSEVKNEHVNNSPVSASCIVPSTEEKRGQKRKAPSTQSRADEKLSASTSSSHLAIAKNLLALSQSAAEENLSTSASSPATLSTTHMELDFSPDNDDECKENKTTSQQPAVLVGQQTTSARSFESSTPPQPAPVQIATAQAHPEVDPAYIFAAATEFAFRRGLPSSDAASLALYAMQLSTTPPVMQQPLSPASSFRFFHRGAQQPANSPLPPTNNGSPPSHHFS